MEINKVNRGAINAYNAIKSTKSADSAKKSVGGTFDSVEIDFSQSVNSAKASVASRLAAQANIEKIKQLQAQYSGDNCPVSAGETAKAVVGE
jgi:anti-sigma28 factor (negative regulator of flagellin synthesis)